MLVDSSFSGLYLDGLNIRSFLPQFGWSDLARLVRRRIISVAKWAKLYVALGRADIADGVSEVAETLQDLAASITRFNPNIMVVLAGPIPRGSDSRRMVARCVNAGKIVKSFCSQQEGFTFSTVACQFYTKKGVNALLVLPGGASGLGKAALKADIRAFS